MATAMITVTRIGKPQGGTTGSGLARVMNTLVTGPELDSWFSYKLIVLDSAFRSLNPLDRALRT